MSWRLSGGVEWPNSVASWHSGRSERPCVHRTNCLTAETMILEHLQGTVSDLEKGPPKTHPLILEEDDSP